MRRTIIDTTNLELTDKVVSIKRVTKVVKGGRNMRFTALVVVGDGNGHVGVGLGKSIEIPEAIRKGKEDAAKHLVSVALDENNSVTHDFLGKYGSSTVLLKVLVSSLAVLPVWFASWLVSRISVPRRWAPPTSRMSFWQPFRD